MRRQFVTLAIISSFLFIFSLSGCSKAKQIKEILLTEDLSIGVESGEGPDMFAEIGDLALDSEENIYILDSIDIKVKKFDKNGNFLKSLEVRRGEGPREVTYITGIAVTQNGRVYAHDRNSGKTLVFDEEFEFIRSFKTDFRTIDILPYSENEFIIMGIKDEKVFHMYNQEGELLESFGETFDIPSEHLKYENMPLVKLPRRADITKDGQRIYLVNLHEYEIRVYEDYKIHHVIKEESEFFTPFKIVASRRIEAGGETVQQISMRFPFISVLEHGKRLYVSMMAQEEDELNHLDVFENERLIASMKIVGFAHAVDSKGRLYTEEEEEYPKVVRYSVKQK